MHILDLPDDIIDYIQNNFLNNSHKRLLNTTGFYRNNPLLQRQINDFIINKTYILNLFFLIKFHQINLFRKIKKTLDYHFMNHLGGMISFNDSCLMYAPHIQYGPCRFCMKHLSRHKYNKMINLYLRLVTEQSDSEDE
jgi:hypothetical protein